MGPRLRRLRRARLYLRHAGDLDLALILAVPLALGVAVFITELCPRPLRAPISFLTELLAAIPSVVYGLWAVFVLVPLMRDVIGPFLVKTLAGPASSKAQTSALVCSRPVSSSPS